jgi:SAM-dependent methyltransferase
LSRGEAAAAARPAALEWICCPACGADTPETLATPDDLLAEREWLDRFHARRTRDGAPAERRKDRVDFTESYLTGVVRCGGCSLVHRNPVLPKAAQVEAYAEDEYPRESLEAAWAADRARHGGTVAELEARLGRTGAVLEVGSFAGGFLDAARRRGWRALGTDVGGQVTDFARAKGLRVLRGELADLPLPRATFDAACVWNCFDHLREPGRDLAILAWTLRPGGLLWIRVPNGDFYQLARRAVTRAGGRGPRATAALALLAYNNFLGFPYLCAYSVPSLERLLDRHGFAVETVRHDALVPLADDWTPGWAWLEERLLKAAARVGSRLLAAATWGRKALAPWVEVLARRRDGPYRPEGRGRRWRRRRARGDRRARGEAPGD